MGDAVAENQVFVEELEKKEKNKRKFEKLQAENENLNGLSHYYLFKLF